MAYKEKQLYYTHTQTQIYMAVNKIYAINFDYDANGTESLGLVKKMLFTHAISLGNTPADS